MIRSAAGTDRGLDRKVPYYRKTFPKTIIFNQGALSPARSAPCTKPGNRDPCRFAVYLGSISDRPAV